MVIGHTRCGKPTEAKKRPQQMSGKRNKRRTGKTKWLRKKMTVK